MNAAAPTPDRRLVGWLSVGQLITWGSVFYGFSLLMEPVERDLGLTRAQSSLAFSLALLAEGLAAWPVGRWIDQGHERAVMTGGSVAIGVLLLLHALVRDAAGFYAVWFGLGLALSATLYTPAFAVVTRRYPLDYRRAIITLTFLGGLASTVFVPLVAALVQQLGWRGAVAVLALLHLGVCAPLHAHWLRGAPPGRARSEASAGMPHDPGARPYMTSRPFLLLGVFIVLLMAVTAAVPPHLVSLLRDAGLSESWAIAIPAAVGVVQVLGRALLYVFERRFDVHLANRLIPCLIPLGLAALLAGHGHAGAALLFVLLYGMGNGMLTIVKGTAIAQYVSRDHVATLNGALGLPTAVARAIAPLMLGLLYGRDHGYAAGLWVLLAASLIAVAALVLAQRARLGRTGTGVPDAQAVQAAPGARKSQTSRES